MTKQFSAGCLLILSLGLAQARAPEDRITQPVDDSKRVTLAGNVSPKIKSGVDQGPVDPSMVIPYLTLAFKPSAAQ